MPRYLTKLTDHQICFVTKEDLDKFYFKSDDQKIESEYDDGSEDSDNEIYNRFEVKKLQEEKENFDISPGFKVSDS